MKPALPTIGRIVHLTLSLELSAAINRDPAIRGNPTSAGETYPLLISRVWPAETYADGMTINGQLMLDGPNNRWMTSVHYGDVPDCWHWPLLPQAAELIGTLEHGISAEEARLRDELITVGNNEQHFRLKSVRLEEELERVRKHELHLIQERDRLLSKLDDERIRFQSYADALAKSEGCNAHLSGQLDSAKTHLECAAERERKLSERLASVAALVTDM